MSQLPVEVLRRITSRFAAITLVAAIGLLTATSATSADKDGVKRVSAGAAGLPLLFFDNFESGKAGHWAPGDGNAWKVSAVGGSKVYSQFKQSKVKNPVRSPFNRSLIKGVTVGSFALDVRLQSTIKDYGHRDLCLFFGYQDPAHLYYVHLGKKMDAHANNIFIVNNKPRLKISKTTTAGTNWDDAWHHARVVRDVVSGTISVYFDDMTKPVMTAIDTTFSWGQVGLGSFDDTGNFDAVYLFGEAVKPGKVGGASGGEVAVVDNTPPRGFKAAFNGKDLSGWKGLMAGGLSNPIKRAALGKEAYKKAQAEADADMKAHWHIIDGALVFDGKGRSLCTAKDYGDFEMLVDWKIKEKGDSGIYLRGAPQVQIWDPKLGNVGSGGLYNNQKNPSKPPAIADNPVGEWNTFRIKMIGEKVSVWLNGVLVVDTVTLENYWDRKQPIFSKGQIELQNHGNTLYFKNVFLREISRN
tara:strand:+ start:40 stop:1446 length:1407 start_codon:yes stop_codon:yes gene_type:complete